MPDMDGAELYEKGSFGRICEPYAVPFFNTRQFNNKQSAQGTDEGIPSKREVSILISVDYEKYFNIIIQLNYIIKITLI